MSQAVQRVLVTTDLSEESVVAFKFADQLGVSFGAEVHLLAVIEDPEQVALMAALEDPSFFRGEIRERLREAVAKQLEELRKHFSFGVEVRTVIREVSHAAHTEIVNYVKTNNIDLVVMASHGRTGIERVFIGSVAEQVVRRANCPVTLVPVGSSRKKVGSKE